MDSSEKRLLEAEQRVLVEQMKHLETILSEVQKHVHKIANLFHATAELGAQAIDQMHVVEDQVERIGADIRKLVPRDEP